MEDNIEFYTQFTQKVEAALVKYCQGKKMIDADLLLVEEIEEVWDKIAPDYMADAVPEIVEYPTVAIAWAGFLGMGVAALWDTDWANYSNRDDLYSVFQKPRGFDCMDEYIMEEMLNLELESKDAEELENVLRSCSYLAEALIRKENIASQSKEAFYCFSIIVKIMFKVGVSVILGKLGYKYTKMVIGDGNIAES